MGLTALFDSWFGALGAQICDYGLNSLSMGLKLPLPAAKAYIFIAFSHGPFKFQFLLTDLAVSSSSFLTAEDFQFLILNLAEVFAFVWVFFLTFLIVRVEVKGQETVSHQLIQSYSSPLSKDKYNHIYFNVYPFTWRTKLISLSGYLKNSTSRLNSGSQTSPAIIPNSLSLYHSSNGSEVSPKHSM